MEKQQIIESLINYTANSIDSNELRSILRDFLMKWENAECDIEGATKKQNAIMDTILEDYAEQILTIFLKNNNPK